MANCKLFQRIDVTLATHQYPIVIHRHGLSDQNFLQQWVSSSQVMVISNTTISPLYLHLVTSAFTERQCDVVVLPDGEAYKNQKFLSVIYDALIAQKHHRDTTVVALGGGVIGDMAGFAAATYQRGVRLIHLPTTLLAQIDASIGGKTGINHSLGKNLIGSFYQPDAVLVDLDTLSTLPEREFKAGLAEMIKYALLAGGQLLVDVEKALKQGLQFNSPMLPYLVGQCCLIKARIVESDEKEENLRALLNLGHTFGHALESYTNYHRWLHGEAVAIGLYCAALLSHEMGIADELLIKQVKHLLDLADLPYAIPQEIDLEELKHLMKWDKKIKNNQLRFVVIKKPGDCYLTDQVTEKNLHNTLITATEGE